jgi:hypothetical protein
MQAIEKASLGEGQGFLPLLRLHPLSDSPYIPQVLDHPRASALGAPGISGCKRACAKPLVIHSLEIGLNKKFLPS